MFEYNQCHGYEVAKLRQDALMRELQSVKKAQKLARPLVTERTEDRWFRAKYVLRSWMHRMAPRLARAML